MTTTVSRILDLFRPTPWGECRHLSYHQVAELLKVDPDVVRKTLGKLAKTYPRRKKQIHICGYLFLYKDKKRYPCPIYRFGDRPDLPRPAPVRREVYERYQMKKKARALIDKLGAQG